MVDFSPNQNTCVWLDFSLFGFPNQYFLQFLVADIAGVHIPPDTNLYHRRHASHSNN